MSIPIAPTTTTEAPTGDQAGPVYIGPGLGLVDITRLSPGVATPPTGHLFRTLDYRSWTDVTPPQALASADPQYFMQASFLDAQRGWVAYGDPDRLILSIYRTTDGGLHWQTMASGTVGDHAGDSTTIQFLSPSLGFMNTIEATAPRSFLSVTHDGGASWQPLADSNPPTSQSLPINGDVAFADALHGVSVLGSQVGCGQPYPSAGDPARGPGVFFSSEGATLWSPAVIAGVPVVAGQELCALAVPTFTSPSIGVMPVGLATASESRVGFLTTHDSGAHFVLSGEAPAVFEPVRTTIQACSERTAYPAGWVGRDGSWWVTGNQLSDGAAVVEVSGDGGLSWRAVRLPGPAPCPPLVYPRTSSAALLQVQDGPNSEVLITNNGGTSWTKVDPLSQP